MWRRQIYFRDFKYFLFNEFLILVEDLTPTIWKASWSNVFLDDRHDNVTTYNASISCIKEFSQDIMVINDQSATFTLTNPFLGKCQIKVSSLNDDGDAAFGQIAFISGKNVKWYSSQ